MHMRSIHPGYSAFDFVDGLTPLPEKSPVLESNSLVGLNQFVKNVAVLLNQLQKPIGVIAGIIGLPCGQKSDFFPGVFCK